MVMCSGYLLGSAQRWSWWRKGGKAHAIVLDKADVRALSSVHKAHQLAFLGWARDSSGREAGDLIQNDGLKERVLSFSRGTITLKKV